MNYKSINRDFRKEFPEFIESYNYFFIDNNVSEEEYQYTLYEGMIVHILDILLEMKESFTRNLLIERFFGYIETMVTSMDDEVVTLAFISFFEYRSYNWFQSTFPFMSENLKKILNNEIPNWSRYFDQNKEPDRKYMSADTYGIRKDLYNIFKEEGYNMHDIPYRYS